MILRCVFKVFYVRLSCLDYGSLLTGLLSYLHFQNSHNTHHVSYVMTFAEGTDGRQYHKCPLQIFETQWLPVWCPNAGPTSLPAKICCFLWDQLSLEASGRELFSTFLWNDSLFCPLSQRSCLRMYCIDTEAIAFMFNEGSSCCSSD